MVVFESKESGVKFEVHRGRATGERRASGVLIARARRRVVSPASSRRADGALGNAVSGVSKVTFARERANRIRAHGVFVAIVRVCGALVDIWEMTC